MALRGNDPKGFTARRQVIREADGERTAIETFSKLNTQSNKTAAWRTWFESTMETGDFFQCKLYNILLKELDESVYDS